MFRPNRFIVKLIKVGKRRPVMHHSSFHYMDSDIILNNNITVMSLRIISQTIVTIHN